MVGRADEKFYAGTRMMDDATKLAHAVLAGLPEAEEIASCILAGKPTPPLPPPCFVDFGKFIERAVEVFGGADEAQAWFLAPSVGLGGKRPVDVLMSPGGDKKIEEHLSRIKQGAYT